MKMFLLFIKMQTQLTSNIKFTVINCIYTVCTQCIHNYRIAAP